MKYIALLLFISLALLSLNSCKKKDAAPIVISTMSYKVDGVAKTAINAGAIPPGARSFSIFGNDAEQSVSLTIYNEIDSVIHSPITDFKVGNYNFDNSLLEMTYETRSSQPGIWYYGHEGGIKITYLTDDRVKGTFEFTASDTSGRVTKTITDGVFDCEIMKR